MTEDCEELITSLDDLLEAERQALISGDLDGLSKMASRKEGLIVALSKVEPSQADALVVLDKKIKRNQELLNNALEGIRKVARRMTAFRRVQETLETYDAQGAKTVIKVKQETSVERLA